MMTSDELAEIVVLSIQSALGPVRADMARLEGILASTLDRVKACEALEETVGTVRERLAAAEARPPIPGPPGRDGRDGVDGAVGADGLGFDDLEDAIEDGGRVLVRRYRQGDRVKEFRHVTAAQVYRGVWQAGTRYDRGDGVTWGGSEWHCQHPTVGKPGDGSAGWQLMVKCGRDGRDVNKGPGA